MNLRCEEMPRGRRKERETYRRAVTVDDGASMRARRWPPVARRRARACAYGGVLCAQRAGEREGEGDERKSECEGEGKDLPPPPYLLAAGGDRGRGISCARSP